MLGWECQRNRVQTKPTVAGRRPATFRPQLEAMEERYLPSSVTVLSAPHVSQQAQVAHTTASFSYSDQIKAQQTTWNLIEDRYTATYSATFSGTATGALPGAFGMTWHYQGIPFYGTNDLVAGGSWRLATTGHKGAILTGTITGGSIVWNRYGMSAQVKATGAVQGAVKGLTGTVSFSGTLSFTHGAFVLTGSWSLNLSQRV
jgi:hypothetical protein